AEDFNPRGMRNYWKNCYIGAVGADAIDVMLDYHGRVPSPFTHQVLYTFRGAVARLGRDDTATACRDARHAFIAIGMWEDSVRDKEQIAYVRDLWSAIQPFSPGGFYPNYEGEPSGHLEAAFGTENYLRLLALKKKYDPDSFFRLNQNIDP